MSEQDQDIQWHFGKRQWCHSVIRLANAMPRRRAGGASVNFVFDLGATEMPSWTFLRFVSPAPAC
jgi:hypothetical protein